MYLVYEAHNLLKYPVYNDLLIRVVQVVALLRPSRADNLRSSGVFGDFST